MITEQHNNSSIENQPLAAWQRVWRMGIAPLLSTNSLLALREGLERDDQRIIQGATTIPPPLMCTQEWPVEAACALGYCGWQGDGLETVGEVESLFARICFECDNLIGEPGGVRWFLNWNDETPRDRWRADLLAEVCRGIAQREHNEAATAEGSDWGEME